ncbi:hypothetical protein REY83_002703, partial [Klebsiella aerogenes]
RLRETPCATKQLPTDNSIYGPYGLPLIYLPCWLKLPVPMASKPPVALPLTGATALYDLVARRRRNAPPPGKALCDKTVANR